MVASWGFLYLIYQAKADATTVEDEIQELQLQPLPFTTNLDSVTPPLEPKSEQLVTQANESIGSAGILIWSALIVEFQVPINLFIFCLGLSRLLIHIGDP